MGFCDEDHLLLCFPCISVVAPLSEHSTKRIVDEHVAAFHDLLALSHLEQDIET